MAVLKSLVAAVALTSFAASADATPNDPSQQWRPADGDRIAFDVYRKGDKFGTHIVTFDQDGNTLTAETDVNLRVGMGPITFFSYTLRSREVWTGNELVSVTGRVKEGGDVETVEAKRQGGVINVDGTAFSGSIEGDLIPSSHWNMAVIAGDRMLSTENGEIIEISPEAAGREMIEVDGQSVMAMRYDIQASVPYSIWYDDEGRWVKLTFQARGDTIEYRLQSLY